jgi:plasmid stabilization system protein ParE
MIRRRLTVVMTPRAEGEIDEAAQWWADRGSPTIVDDAVEATLEKIQRFPEIAPRIERHGAFTTTRRATVDPLGFNLFYDARAGTIVVRCFRHQSRRPPRL